MERISQAARREAAPNAAVVREAIKSLYAAWDRVEPGSPAAAAYSAAIQQKQRELAELERGGH